MHRLYARRISHLTEAYLTNEWGRSHEWMHHVSAMNEQRLTNEWTMSHLWMSHISLMGLSCLPCDAPTRSVESKSRLTSMKNKAAYMKIDHHIWQDTYAYQKRRANMEKRLTYIKKDAADDDVSTRRASCLASVWLRDISVTPWFVCDGMYICIYTYIYMYTCMYIDIYTYTYMWIHIHMHIRRISVTPVAYECVWSPYEWGMSRVCMSQSHEWGMYGWVMSHVSMSNVSHTNASGLLMNEACLAYE